MKNLAQLALTGILAFGSTSALKAIVWTDYQSGSPLAHLSEGNPTYNGQFNILTDGYNPAAHYVSSAKVWFAFADDDLLGDVIEQEWVEIDLNSDLFLAAEVDGSHVAFDWVSGGITGNLLLTLSSIGKLDYSVTIIDTQPGWRGIDLINNSTYLKVAKLKAWGDYSQVPDAGATVAFLGLGLVGLAAARKRFR